jgi:uncharacterized RDD family membrane protein YckC
MTCPHCCVEVSPDAARCPACQAPLAPSPPLTGPATGGIPTGMGLGEAFVLRFIAYLIDFVLVGLAAGLIENVVLIPLMIASHVGTSENAFAFARTGTGGVGLLVYLGLWAAYGGIMLPRYGQTLGKMAVGVRVSDSYGANLPVVQAALRESLCKLVSYIACLFGFLAMLWDPQQQTWHDKMVGTHVVRTYRGI